VQQLSSNQQVRAVVCCCHLITHRS
jgi:hypothetical protein